MVKGAGGVTRRAAWGRGRARARAARGRARRRPASGARAPWPAAPSRTAGAAGPAAAAAPGAAAGRPCAPTSAWLSAAARPSCRRAARRTLPRPRPRPTPARRSRTYLGAAESCSSSAQLADKGLATADARLGHTRHLAAVYWVADRDVRRQPRTVHASPAPPFPAVAPPSPAASVVFPIPMWNGGACGRVVGAFPPARPAAPCPHNPALVPRALFELVSFTIISGFASIEDI